MKNVMIGGFLFAWVGMAFGSAVDAPQNIRLALRVTPIKNLSGHERSAITINSRGVVVGEKCRVGAPKSCHQYTLARLDAYAIDRIDRGIEEARRDRLVKWTGPVCKALPYAQAVYRADRGSLVLKRGPRPCGAPTYREGRAAQALVALLDRYDQQLARLP